MMCYAILGYFEKENEAVNYANRLVRRGVYKKEQLSVFREENGEYTVNVD